jgi:DnaJ-class molecular chaperone
LGIATTANESDIKKSFYKLAKVHHPDATQSASKKVKDESEEKFKSITAAYTILSDKDKKSMYD